VPDRFAPVPDRFAPVPDRFASGQSCIPRRWRSDAAQGNTTCATKDMLFMTDGGDWKVGTILVAFLSPK